MALQEGAFTLIVSADEQKELSVLMTVQKRQADSTVDKKLFIDLNIITRKPNSLQHSSFSGKCSKWITLNTGGHLKLLFITS